MLVEGRPRVGDADGGTASAGAGDAAGATVSAGDANGGIDTPPTDKAPQASNTVVLAY